MSLDLAALRTAVLAHGTVVRIVIARAQGSAPREVGAAMLVWNGGQAGTIGGGALEHEAVLRARHRMGTRTDWLQTQALGPDLGQCCGGRVTLLAEAYDAERLTVLAATLPRPFYARPGPGTADRPTSAVQRLIAGLNLRDEAQWLDGWMIEPLARAARPLWIFGAGHVGRALVRVLSPLPHFRITWIDTARDRFPERIDPLVNPAIAENPADLLAHAPAPATHLILTYSHALDLELCHRLLGRRFDYAGLIGSASKWARFRRRLAGMGHGDTEISRIKCPIGAPALGKHPQAIAIGVATDLLERLQKTAHERHWPEKKRRVPDSQPDKTPLVD